MLKAETRHMFSISKFQRYYTSKFSRHSHFMEMFPRWGLSSSIFFVVFCLYLKLLGTLSGQQELPVCCCVIYRDSTWSAEPACEDAFTQISFRMGRSNKNEHFILVLIVKLNVLIKEWEVRDLFFPNATYFGKTSSGHRLTTLLLQPALCKDSQS